VAIEAAAAVRLDSLVYNNVAEPGEEEQAVGLVAGLMVCLDRYYLPEKAIFQLTLLFISQYVYVYI